MGFVPKKFQSVTCSGGSCQSIANFSMVIDTVREKRAQVYCILELVILEIRTTHHKWSFASLQLVGFPSLTSLRPPVHAKCEAKFLMSTSWHKPHVVCQKHQPIACMWRQTPPNSHTCKAQPFIIQLTSSTSLHHSTPDRSKLQGTLNSANSKHIFRSQFDLTTFPHLRRHCFSWILFSQLQKWWLVGVCGGFWGGDEVLPQFVMQSSSRIHDTNA